MTRKFVPTKLKLRRPVPSDIEIAQESDIKPITQVALELARKIKGYQKQRVNGLHIMPVMWEEIIPCIVIEAGLLPEGFVPTESNNN